MTTFGIIGGGFAGAKAAETLREEGFDGDIFLVAEEAELPYERPPLSKGLLLGDAERDSVFVHDADWYATNRISLRLGVAAVGLDAQARRVTLVDRSTLDYDKLLLATGSSPRRLDVPGADLDGVHYLRTLGDSDRISAALTEGAHIVIIGAGWIGLEIASAARRRGAIVTVLETLALPLQRILGDEVAQVFADLHRQHGVTFHFQEQVQALLGTHKASSVLLANGTEIPCDAVIVGVGITPNVLLAEQAGLQVDNGIVCDQTLRTSDPHIWAAGDVANAYHPLLHKQIRVEHWANALNGGPAAARAMLGSTAPYDHLPYFFTDQYDLGMEYIGYAGPGDYDSVVFRGSVATREFIAFWTNRGRVVAAMNVNIWDVQDDLRALITSGQTIPADRLADPEVPLPDLLT